jgi:hypothetical protein
MAVILFVENFHHILWKIFFKKNILSKILCSFKLKKILQLPINIKGYFIFIFIF